MRNRTENGPILTRSLYTDEKLSAAQENIRKYPWAKELRDKAEAEADCYVDKADRLWHMVTPQSIPRGITVGFINDPEAWICPYCKTDLRAEHSIYPWLSDPMNDPWKIKCPACGRRFPSNDFGKYYESGLDRHGIFAAGKADRSLLTNDLYPEKGPGWGVDDGYGFVTGKKFENGVTENKTFIAYYNHYGLWMKSGTNPGVLITALNWLREAYLYTGDIRYGRTGAILLDRIADLYPTFDLFPYKDYYNSHGMSWEGKIVGREWETFIAADLAKAVDAFRPAMADPEVIGYLSEASRKYGLANKKTGAGEIAENCETGILREIYAGVKKAQIYGNFGMHQYPLALAAVVLNRMPETGEWIDYLFRPGGYVGKAPNSALTGGNILAQLINKVDRDGFGNEAAPGYNLLWISKLLGVAQALDGYRLYPGADLYNNPKFEKMFDCFASLIMCSRYTSAIGDTGSTACNEIEGNLSAAVMGFRKYGTVRLAQYIHALSQDADRPFQVDLFTPDPEKIRNDIGKIIREHGPLPGKSENLAGYGLAVLRDGGMKGDNDTQRVFDMYYGRTTGHGHQDMLNLGVYAYGLNLAPDLGYPEATGVNQNRLQWVQNTISHNTAAVNSKGQKLIYGGTPKHFDDTPLVKVMDVNAPEAYDDTSIYRRTVVMVKINEEISYALDFFRICGGSDHVYSFHAQSDEISETEGLCLTAQKDAAGNYTGTYEGPDAAWGEAAADPENPSGLEKARMASGYTWLDHIDRDSRPERNFSVDWKIKDFRNVFPGREGLHLKLVSLNKTAADEVSVADGTPPRIKGNPEKLKYLLIRRKGKNLDTLFTSVLEPYQGENNILKAELVSMTASGPRRGSDDAARAVKISLKNGRTDYIVYAADSDSLFRVDGKFDFRGFTGVYSEQDGHAVFSYLNDGDIIAENREKSAYKGTVLDFTKTLSGQNRIEVRFDSRPDENRVADLAGRFIYVKNDGLQNAAYRILSAKTENGKTILEIGDITLIRSYRNFSKMEDGYRYNVEAGQKFEIPFSRLLCSVPYCKA